MQKSSWPHILCFLFFLQAFILWFDLYLLVSIFVPFCDCSMRSNSNQKERLHHVVLSDRMDKFNICRYVYFVNSEYFYRQLNRRHELHCARFNTNVVVFLFIVLHLQLDKPNLILLTYFFIFILFKCHQTRVLSLALTKNVLVGGRGAPLCIVQCH